MAATQDEKNALYGAIPSTNCVKNYVLTNLDLIDGKNAAGSAVANALVTAIQSANTAFAAGIVALDGSNPTAVSVSGMSAIAAASVSYEKATAPGDDPSWLTVSVSGTTLNIYAWKNTGGTDPTLVASTDTGNVHWIAIGTRG